MTITTTNPPSDVDVAFREAISGLNEKNIKNRAEILNAGFKALPIFALTPEDFANSRLPSNSSGWLLAPNKQGENVSVSEPALVEVSAAGEKGEKAQFASFSQGLGAKAFFANLVKVLERQFAGQGLEIRFLRFPAMLVSAFWIYSPEEEYNRIIVIRGPSAFKAEEILKPEQGLTPKQLLTPQQFFDTLRPLVDKFSAFTEIA